MIDTSLYVGLSGQLALQRRMDTIAHNVANTSTAGFRADRVKFETVLNRFDLEPIAFSSTGKDYLSLKTGAFVQTGNPLDVAVKGDAWLAIDTPDGQVFTRDGRLQMSTDGIVQTLNAHAVLDVGGAPIQIDPNAGPPVIMPDGMIVQNGRQVGALGLFRLNADSKLEHYENSGVTSDRPAEPVLDFSTTGVQQGFIEQSNVSPILEMTRMIEVTRTFEAISKNMEETNGTFREAIRTLGGNE